MVKLGSLTFRRCPAHAADRSTCGRHEAITTTAAHGSLLETGYSRTAHDELSEFDEPEQRLMIVIAVSISECIRVLAP